MFGAAAETAEAYVVSVVDSDVADVVDARGARAAAAVPEPVASVDEDDEDDDDVVRDVLEGISAPVESGPIAEGIRSLAPSSSISAEAGALSAVEDAAMPVLPRDRAGASASIHDDFVVDELPSMTLAEMGVVAENTRALLDMSARLRVVRSEAIEVNVVLALSRDS